MRIKPIVATLLATVALSVASAGLIAAQNGMSSRGSSRTAAIILQCHNYGGQQDVAKNPDIINSTQQTIPKGKTLYWKSSDGDSGSVKLDKALAPGGKVGVNGKPGQSYSCTAWMNK